MTKRFYILGSAVVVGALLLWPVMAGAEMNAVTGGMNWYGPGQQPMSPGTISPNPYAPSLPLAGTGSSAGMGGTMPGTVGPASPGLPGSAGLQRGDAQTMLNKFMTINPNLSVGPVKDQGPYYRANVYGKDGSKVNEVLVDKATGAMHSVY